MSGSYDTHNLRIAYRGGSKQHDRMVNDKLRSLKKALLYSYQAGTVELSDGRHFKALINTGKTHADYDQDNISIPFEDICLNPGVDECPFQTIGLKPGDTFCWLDTNTYWLVYLQFLDELAYFRGQIYRCDHELTIGENTYKIYFKGPAEKNIQWNQKNQSLWNELNYSAVIYVTKNQETLDFFHRFTTIEIEGQNWEVQVVDSQSTIGIIEVFLKETNNTNYIPEEQPDPPTPSPDEDYILGPARVESYEQYTYTIVNNTGVAAGGTWSIDSTKATILSQDTIQCKIGIVSGKSGYFTLTYSDGVNFAFDMVISINTL